MTVLFATLVSLARRDAERYTVMEVSPTPETYNADVAFMFTTAPRREMVFADPLFPHRQDERRRYNRPDWLFARQTTTTMIP